MANTPTLETERLILRRFTENDLEALYEILSDEEVNAYLPWFPARGLEDARRFYEERCVAHYALPRAHYYAICLKEDDRPIGYVKVSPKEPHDFGYFLRKEFWHRGIATEAARAVIEQACRDGIPYITATHDRYNPRSGGVMRNVGMTYRYSYEEQWQPKNVPVTFRMYQLNFTRDADWTHMGYWDAADVRFVVPGL